MDLLYIFGAKYLFALSPLIALVFFLKQSFDIKKKIVFFAVFAIPLIYLVAFLAGLAYDNPRPFVAENFIPLVEHAADNGFPSGHTLFTASIAAIIYFFNRRIGNILLLIAMAVGMSRVGAGVHHSIDILASIVIAFGVAWIVSRVIRKSRVLSRE